MIAAADGIQDVHDDRLGAPPLLDMRGITKVFPGTTALHSVDLAVRSGEVHVLVGENGSGKSTLMRVAAGAVRATEGSVSVDGNVRHYHRPADATADGIVLVTQEGALVPDVSVTENIFLGRLGRRGRRVDWGGLHRAARGLLEQVGLDLDPRRITRLLPPDQRQLVEIARGLSYDSRVLLLDEPTSALDLAETGDLLAIIRRLARRGLAVVFVSHRMTEMLDAGDRFTVLRDGRVVGTRDRSEVSEDWLVRTMVGRDLQRANVHAAPTSAPVTLDVTRLQDRDGRVRGIDLHVRAGEIVGLAGLVGAGRSEILETVAGLRHRAAGTVTVDGEPVGSGVPSALGAGIALVAEDRQRQALIGMRSVHENATLTLPLGRSGIRRRRSREHAVAGPWIERLAVRCASLDQPISALSGGNQQKVVLVRALVTRPRVLLLDEPTRGIDLAAKHRIYEEVIGLAAEGVAVLVASSELPELLAVCHRLLVVREGRIVAGLSSDLMNEEGIVAAATGANADD